MILECGYACVCVWIVKDARRVSDVCGLRRDQDACQDVTRDDDVRECVSCARVLVCMNE